MTTVRAIQRLRARSIARGQRGRRHSIAIAVGLACAGWRARAQAGGFEVPDLGTVPIGRGGAFVAKADTLAAFHYNPAGLSKLPGPNLLVSGNAVHLRSRFRRRGGGEDVQLPWNDDGITVLDPAGDVNTGRPFPEVSNARRFGPSPMFVASLGDAGDLAAGRLVALRRILVALNQG